MSQIFSGNSLILKIENMNIESHKQSRGTPSSEALGRCTIDTESFDFDSWAVAVRQQLLASLQKRADRPS